MAAIIQTPPSWISDAPVSPYEDTDFQQCWVNTLATKFNLIDQRDDLVITRRSAYKGLLDFKELRVAGWNMGWPQHLTIQRLQTLQSFLGEPGWDYFRMKWSVDQPQDEALSLLKQLGYSFIHVPAHAQYTVDLSQGWNHYFQQKTNSGRKDVKRKLKAVQDMHPEIVVIENHPDAIDAFFEEFFAYHITYWDQKIGASYFRDPQEQAFIKTWCKALAQKGQLRLEGLKLNGEMVNLRMSVIIGNTMYWLITINTGKYNEIFPGLVALYIRLQKAAEMGIQQLHLGAGDYAYKIQAASHKADCFDLIIANPKSLRGRAYVANLGCSIQ